MHARGSSGHASRGEVAPLATMDSPGATSRPTASMLRGRSSLPPSVSQRAVAPTCQRRGASRPAVSRAVAQRMLHEPTLRLKEMAGTEAAYEAVNTLQELFGLNTETDPGGGSEATVTPIRREEG